MDFKIKKNDIILIGLLLVIAVFAYGGIYLYQDKSTGDGIVVVTVDGKEYATYSLKKNLTHTIEFPDGSYNTIEIADGKAQVTNASCPDKICVRHRPIDKNGQSIVCLPNKLVIQIKNRHEADVDSYTN